MAGRALRARALCAGVPGPTRGFYGFQHLCHRKSCQSSQRRHALRAPSFATGCRPHARRSGACPHRGCHAVKCRAQELVLEVWHQSARAPASAGSVLRAAASDDDADVFLGSASAPLAALLARPQVRTHYKRAEMGVSWGLLRLRVAGRAPCRAGLIRIALSNCLWRHALLPRVQRAGRAARGTVHRPTSSVRAAGAARVASAALAARAAGGRRAGRHLLHRPGRPALAVGARLQARPAAAAAARLGRAAA